MSLPLGESACEPACSLRNSVTLVKKFSSDDYMRVLTISVVSRPPARR